jgi:hypothetical protein
VQQHEWTGAAGTSLEDAIVLTEEAGFGNAAGVERSKLHLLATKAPLKLAHGQHLEREG